MILGDQQAGVQRLRAVTAPARPCRCWRAGWPKAHVHGGGVPIIDEAKVAGVYTFKLEWDQTEWEPRPIENDQHPGDSAASAPPDAPPPSLFAVLQQQLGLRLEPRKVPTEVIVIDRAEKPILY